MNKVNLSQEEADALIALEKQRIDEKLWQYPGPGESLIIPLLSIDKKEDFFLDVKRGRIDLYKGTFQNRGRNVVVLVRIDFGGSPHRNPDDIEVPSPHIHIYKENYGDKWAFPIPREFFTNISDPWQTLEDFMRYCNITNRPIIQRGLW